VFLFSGIPDGRKSPRTFLRPAETEQTTLAKSSLIIQEIPCPLTEPEVSQNVICCNSNRNWISGSHSTDYEENDLVGCNAV
jgi:hypothetical protein